MAQFDYKAWLNGFYRCLDPKYKKWGWIVVALAVGLLFLFVGVSRTPTKKPLHEPKTSRNLLGDKTRFQQLAVTGLSSRLDKMERENKELRDKLEQWKEKTGKAAALEQAHLDAEIAKRLAKEVAKLKEAGVIGKEKPEGGKVGANKEVKEARQAGRRTRTGTARTRKSDNPPWAAKTGASNGAAGVPGPPGVSAAREIKVIGASSEGDKMQVKDKKKKDEIETFLPAGSIFSGTLITGLDVSCGKSSKKDPFPVLLRIKKEAILPNMYRADVRECFLIAAGWGDLGSERAYLRGERLSCIREDGKAIESKIDMYAVGEDGKAGVRGRLVSKTGALLSRALMAGFMQGFSQVFTKQPVAVIATGQPGQTAPFQNMLSKNAMESAGLQGAGSALERLSKYYIDMAKDIFPVIEIDAGRAIDFVMISGKKLALQTRKSAG